MNKKDLINKIAESGKITKVIVGKIFQSLQKVLARLYKKKRMENTHDFYCSISLLLTKHILCS